MQLLLDLVLIFKDAVDPALSNELTQLVNMNNLNRGTYLEHVFSHCAVHAMLKRLILEVELNIVLIFVSVNSYVKEDFNGTLRNRSQLVWLAELHVIPVRKRLIHR